MWIIKEIIAYVIRNISWIFVFAIFAMHYSATLYFLEKIVYNCGVIYLPLPFRANFQIWSMVVKTDPNWNNYCFLQTSIIIAFFTSIVLLCINIAMSRIYFTRFDKKLFPERQIYFACLIAAAIMILGVNFYAPDLISKKNATNLGFSLIGSYYIGTIFLYEGFFGLYYWNKKRSA